MGVVPKGVPKVDPIRFG